MHFEGSCEMRTLSSFYLNFYSQDTSFIIEFKKSEGLSLVSGFWVGI